MNTAEWILVAILSITLFVFLVIGIILLIKLIGLSEEAKEVIKTSQKVAEKTGDVVDNVKDFTSVGGIFKAIAKRIENNGITLEIDNKSKKTTSKNAKESSPKEAETISKK
ncbi:hypothetical protein IKF63_01535 [Candidatus Saccharibacteria bacterium]|nr:hypothetical protein [Candidatus Saccharibacteria bacterium]